MDQQVFGKYIALHRKQLHLTQEQLAQQLHVTGKAVSKWERGLSYPDVTLLEPLAAALEMNVHSLLCCRSPDGDDEQSSGIAAVVEISAQNQRQEKAKWFNAFTVLAIVILLLLVIVVIDRQHARRSDPMYHRTVARCGIEMAERGEGGNYVYIRMPETQLLLRLRCSDDIDPDALEMGWHHQDGALVQAIYELEYDRDDGTWEGALYSCVKTPEYHMLAPTRNTETESAAELPLFGMESTCTVEQLGWMFFYVPGSDPGTYRLLVALQNGGQEIPYVIGDYDADGQNELLTHVDREWKPYVLYDMGENGELTAVWLEEAPSTAP